MMKTRDRKMLDMAEKKARYDMQFWEMVCSIANRLNLKPVSEYADMKWRAACGASLTLIRTALNIQAQRLEKHS